MARRNLRTTAAPDQALPVKHVDADSIDQAIDLLSRDGAIVFAGGVGLFNKMKNRFPPQAWDSLPHTLVNIKTIDELYGISRVNDGLEIGSSTGLSTVAESKAVRQTASALADAAESVGTPQLRNQITIGGNLAQDSRCSYYRNGLDCYRAGGFTCYAETDDSSLHSIKNKGRCITVHPSDVAPATAALDAQVEIAGPSGRRSVDILDFFVRPQNDITTMNILGDDELITKITIPQNSGKQDFTKIANVDFAIMNVATVLGDSVRIALNGIAPTPIRVGQAESVIENSGVSEQSAREAGVAFADTTSPNPETEYKVPMVKGLIRDSIMAASGG